MNKFSLLFCSALLLTTTASAKKMSVIQESNISSEAEVALSANITTLSDIKVVKVEKPGTLKKLLGKEDFDIPGLKIEGELNVSDFSYLYGNFHNLESLDLSEVKQIDCQKAVKWKDESGKHEIFIHETEELPIYINNKLISLSLPASFEELIFENRESRKSVRDLHVSSSKGLRSKISCTKNLYLDYFTPSECKGYGLYEYYFKNGEFSLPDYVRDAGLIDKLYVLDYHMAFYNYLFDYNPAEIICKKDKFKALMRYTGNEKNVDTSEYNFLGQCAFMGTDVESVHVGDLIGFIPVGCFANCAHLRQISGMKNVESVQDAAFWGVPAEKIVFSENIKRLSKSAFANSHVKDVEFLSTTAPTELGYNPRVEVSWDIYNKANSSIYFSMPRLQTLNITIAKGESLDKYITDQNADKISGLIIKGEMYSDQIEYIEKCHNLCNGDLSQLKIYEKSEEDDLGASYTAAVSQARVNKQIKNLKNKNDRDALQKMSDDFYRGFNSANSKQYTFIYEKPISTKNFPFFSNIRQHYYSRK